MSYENWLHERNVVHGGVTSVGPHSPRAHLHKSTCAAMRVLFVACCLLLRVPEAEATVRFTAQEAQAAQHLFEKNRNCDYRARHVNSKMTGRLRAACVRYSECLQIVANSSTADILECMTRRQLESLCDSPAMCAKGIRSAGGHVCCPAACRTCDHRTCIAYPEPEPTIGDVESCCIHTIWSRAVGVYEGGNYNASCRSPNHVGCPLHRGPGCHDVPRPSTNHIVEYKVPLKVSIPPRLGRFSPQWDEWVTSISRLPPSPSPMNAALNPPAPICDSPSMCARGIRSAGGTVCCAPDCGDCDSSLGTHGRRACFLRAGGRQECCSLDIWTRQLALNTSCQSPEEVACRLYRGQECTSLPALSRVPAKLDLFDWQSRLMDLDGPAIGHSRWDATAIQRLNGRFDQHSMRPISMALQNRSSEAVSWLQSNHDMPELDGKVRAAMLYRHRRTFARALSSHTVMPCNVSVSQVDLVILYVNQS